MGVPRLSLPFPLFVRKVTMAHNFVFIGVRTDQKSRAIAFHEWCSHCGTVRSTRFSDGDVVHLVVGTPDRVEDPDRCPPRAARPTVQA